MNKIHMRSILNHPYQALSLEMYARAVKILCQDHLDRLLKVIREVLTFEKWVNFIFFLKKAFLNVKFTTCPAFPVQGVRVNLPVREFIYLGSSKLHKYD